MFKKVLKIILIPIVFSCFLSSCKDVSNDIPVDLQEEHIVRKGNNISFDIVNNTFNFDNFTTKISDGNCFGICMTEKCVFEGSLKTYYPKFGDDKYEENLFDYNIDSSVFDDKKRINIDLIHDNDCKKMINCIMEFQNNQHNYYDIKDLSIHDIIEEINKDSPVILILKYKDKSDSHAVLAYGYKKDKDNNKAVKLLIADPNKIYKLTDEQKNCISVVTDNSSIEFSPYRNEPIIIIYEARLHELNK